MISKLKKLLVSDVKPESGSPEKIKKKIVIATCVLLLEIAKADDEFSIEEKKVINSLLEKDFSLSGEEIEDIIKLAEEDRRESIDLWEYTHLINENFSQSEKIMLIEKVWEVIYADGTLDKFENYMVHKLADLLRLSHEDLISAKLKIKPAGIGRG
jgi:uncharacterized tellurite resistance protein B-like protein